MGSTITVYRLLLLNSFTTADGEESHEIDLS
ncbi:hypothetical protein L861_00325 [Litchfieldella anticariensis FP35 = DSM 16096]|uniref:Uncharacterized protein n=1 Tax=Litchfieldella anticariensis (strain DSM 16096 / CECT 5854 / CIP 108499 / LMG 22089 / FP35) TaxID=1121939 RepID=S2L7J1_LITA3|nr:hypothetical protein L861_00325 [Halomonas anticariensis FP35 = DSM 16096]